MKGQKIALEELAAAMYEKEYFLIKNIAPKANVGPALPMRVVSTDTECK